MEDYKIYEIHLLTAEQSGQSSIHTNDEIGPRISWKTLGFAQNGEQHL